MSEKTALIRRCDTCGKVTAIDMENTPENKKELEYSGQTVIEVTNEEAAKEWPEAGECRCAKKIKVQLFDGTPVMQSSARVLTCVYCGHEYPQATPAWGDKALTDHIKACPKHPMRKAEADIAFLREALFAIVGVRDKSELEQLELIVQAIPIPGIEKQNLVRAIQVLLMTMPAKGGE